MRSNSHAEQFNLKETQIAIKCLKDYFERELSSTLNLLRVTAPLFVQPQTGLNDNLSGTEKPLIFTLLNRSYTVKLCILLPNGNVWHCIATVLCPMKVCTPI